MDDDSTVPPNGTDVFNCGDIMTSQIVARVRARDLEQRLQKRAVLMLFVSCLSALLAFGVSFLIGIHKVCFERLQQNFLGDSFASGMNHVPSTVSEMVHDHNAPEGFAFNAFCLIGSICLLGSWYPMSLRNVYVGDDHLIYCTPISWATFRHFFPPIGMLLVTSIPAKPPANRVFGDNVAIVFHTLGAVLMIGGYCISELHCLLCNRKASRLMFKPGERQVRLALVLLCLVCGFAFQIFGVLDKRAKFWTCADVWKVPTEAQLEYLLQNRSLAFLSARAEEAARTNTLLLYNTASGACLNIKSLEFFSETGAGLFMILSLFAIWWYCPERHVDLDEELPPVRKEFLQQQGYDDCYVAFGYSGGGSVSDGSSDEESSS
eukprot:TRINITY_DN49263_c0_g1_i1.p1 TRINITY_DN49263_c0_g1~~TRINITY_DN49263_c0_g1_i1.p1  ORF type:complete len:393 (-),score=53.57 TRINITY_DN49263_c0_g1_i1:36-1166(-)